MSLKLITPRRNFLIRALGFTAAGATLPIGIITADDARARIGHHQSELEKAWADYYGPDAVRTYADVRPPAAVRQAVASAAPPFERVTDTARRFTPGGFSFEAKFNRWLHEPLTRPDYA
jgi:hypothetical protein